VREREIKHERKRESGRGEGREYEEIKGKRDGEKGSWGGREKVRIRKAD
jgi:hypothetical protein